MFGETSLSQFSAETSQKKDLNLQDISSTLRDAATPEVSSQPIVAGYGFVSRSAVSHPQTLHPTCLELFHHVDALLATDANGQEEQQSTSTQASNLAPNRESLHVRSLVDLVAQKLLQFPSLGNDATIKGEDSRRWLNKSH